MLHIQLIMSLTINVIIMVTTLILQLKDWGLKVCLDIQKFKV
jgi:hypothetical protein